ncbi:hypothetical protein SBRCBS47491_005287 [Sporothrix bragantina]|uniref:REJ domain-containing protein n=1 Tax=Sporothrix bragantina TaxID=671064 RepID=A0ABP0BVQ0_9PEZI
MSQFDKDKLHQELSSLPLSTISTSIAASATSTAAAAASSSMSNMSSYSNSTSTTTSNPAFLSMVITGAVNEVLSSSTNYSS